MTKRATLQRIAPIKLIVDPKVQRRFRKQAIEKFPNETIAYLLGYDLGSRIEVVELWSPPAANVQATNSELDFDAHIDWEAFEHAKESELHLVGDIHTHPWTKAQCEFRRHVKISTMIHPSATDWEFRMGLRWLTGICLIEEREKGFYTKFRYWGPLTPIELCEQNGAK